MVRNRLLPEKALLLTFVSALLSIFSATSAKAYLFESIQKADQRYGRRKGVPPEWLMGKKEVGAVYQTRHFSVYCVFDGDGRYSFSPTSCTAVVYEKSATLSAREVASLLQKNATNESWTKVGTQEWLSSTGIHAFENAAKTLLLVATDEHLTEIGGYKEANLARLEPTPSRDWEREIERRREKARPQSSGGEVQPDSPGGTDGSEAARLLPASETENVLSLLRSAVVANSTAPLYAAILNDACRDPASPQFGLEAQKGVLLARVRTGFLLKAAENCTDFGLCGIAPVALGTETIFFGLQSNFSAINQRVKAKLKPHSSISIVPNRIEISGLQPYPTTTVTELLDPFEVTSTILFNAKGTIANAYRCLPERKRGNAVLGVARTPSGYFLGYFRERNTLQNSRYTWEQILTARDWNFALTPKKKTSLQRGSRILRLASLKKPARPQEIVSDPADAQVKPVHYETILQSGLPGLMADLNTPTDDGAQIEKPPAQEPPEKKKNQLEYSSYVEIDLQEISLNFIWWSEARTIVEIEQKQNERKVETWLNGAMSAQAQMGPWKPVKIKSTRRLENDLDGGCRLTDGQSIYEIRKAGFEVTLTQYSVDPNPFLNKPR